MRRAIEILHQLDGPDNSQLLIAQADLQQFISEKWERSVLYRILSALGLKSAATT
jgi:hypothetical protein